MPGIGNTHPPSPTHDGAAARVIGLVPLCHRDSHGRAMLSLDRWSTYGWNWTDRSGSPVWLVGRVSLPWGVTPLALVDRWSRGRCPRPEGMDPAGVFGALQLGG